MILRPADPAPPPKLALEPVRWRACHVDGETLRCLDRAASAALMRNRIREGRWIARAAAVVAFYRTANAGAAK